MCIRDSPSIAGAALYRAQLTGEEWAELIPRLPIRARGFLRHRRDLPDGAVRVLDRLGVSDRALPQPIAAPPVQPAEDLPAEAVDFDDVEPLVLPQSQEEATPASDVEPDPPIAEPEQPTPIPTPAEPSVRPEPVAAPSAPRPAAEPSGRSDGIRALVERIETFRKARSPQPVSYTHLTLPTILRV